jgi:hypothetical protein
VIWLSGWPPRSRFLGRDQVILSSPRAVELDPIPLSGESLPPLRRSRSYTAIPASCPRRRTLLRTRTVPFARRGLRRPSAVDKERDLAALGDAAAVVRELHANLVLARRDDVEPSTYVCLQTRRSCSSTSDFRPSRTRLQPPVMPPMATMTPSAPDFGTSISAVTAWDLFAMFTIASDGTRVSPPKTIWRFP